MIDKKKIADFASEIAKLIATRGQLEELRTSFKMFSDFLDEQQLDRIALSINYSDDQKLKLLLDSLDRFSGKKEGILNSLFERILSDKLFELLNPDNFNFLVIQLFDHVSSFKKIKMAVAVELEQQDYLEIKNKLRRNFDEEIILDVAKKPNILGGFILQYDSVIIDASIEKSLEIYRHDWVATLNKLK